MGSSAVAVIGMAGRFPGADNIEQLWKNLRAGVESIRFFTDEELLAAGESPELLKNPAYVRACPQLADIDKFDAAFFGMSPRDAAVFDPQHRFFLECAWAAFEHAGYVGEKLDLPVGVFGACGMSEYMIKNVLANPEVALSVGEWLIRHTGNDTNFLATRVSYELDLRGPAMNVQTACSSSLVAIHLACQSLLNRECDLALAGGSTITPEQHKGYLYREGEILSPDGHCRAFDARSAGTTSSSATGCLVLKRLEDAEADGDQVLAVIRGSAVNNDGRDKVGYLAPSVSGQARVIAEALAVAGVEARDISYVEAHGTGTLIGDPIEVAGLTQAFRESTDDRQFCGIGSLKTNIGHAGEASGAASFIKTVLALNARELPPSLNYSEPNPQADFESSPFYVNAELREWKTELGKPRLAGITGLGAGGTNAHVIVEEAKPRPLSGPSRQTQLLTLSAKTATALEQATKDLHAFLLANPKANLADVAFTRMVGRKSMPHRRALAVKSVEQAVGLLGSLDARSVATGQAKGEAPSVVFMFPGGGAQYAGMGRELYEKEEVYRRAIDTCANLVRGRLGLDLRTLLFPTEELETATRKLERPSVALPALFATEYALAKLLESWGVTPKAMIGHSAGEYAAACLSGVIAVEDALALVATRGRLFETLPEGAMTSVSLSEADARARLTPGLSIAANNAAQLCVVAGPKAELEAFEAALAKDDVEHARIHIDVAAHSSMLEPILKEFEAFCRTVKFSAPKIPFVSNVTGRWIEASQAVDPKYWVQHLRQTVRFGEGIETVLADANRALIEIGPGRTLASLARQAKTQAAAIAPTVRHPKEDASDVAFLMLALGRAWAAGVPLEPQQLYANEQRHRVALPTYPFERKRYWVEPGKSDKPAALTKALHKRSDVREWFYTPAWRRAATGKRTAASPQRWLLIREKTSRLADAVHAQLVEQGHHVVPVVQGSEFADDGERGYTLDPSRKSDWEAVIASLQQGKGLPDRIVHLSSMREGVGVLSALRPGRWSALAKVEKTLARDWAGLLHLMQALGPDCPKLSLAVVTNGVHPVLAEHALSLHPDRALLHGLARVIPREYPQVKTVAIDLEGDLPTLLDTDGARVTQLVRELEADLAEDVVAFRGGARYVRRFEPTPLEPAETQWAKPRGTYLISGGLGGIGYAVAEHLARTVKAKLVLLGRSALPPESSWPSYVAQHHDATAAKLKQVLKLRELGGEVMVVSADVTDRAAMTKTVADARARFGHIDGVVHSAGVLRDGLIALRPAYPSSEVLDVKVKGALMLDAVLADDPPDVLVLFSSVSSVLGLPGQADYSAANAFLDAFAQQKAAEHLGTRKTKAFVINWNAWAEVGMAVDLARASAEQETGPALTLVPGNEPVKPLLEKDPKSDAETARFSASFSRARHWVLSEHVVRGGEALLPGTSFVEFARLAAGTATGKVAEIRNLFFLAPFVVRKQEVRKLQLKVSRPSSEVVIFSDSDATPHVTAFAELVDAPAPRHHDLAAIAARCTVRRETFEGYSKQAFMSFGPRWGSLKQIDYGKHEALAKLELPAAYEKELQTHWLHPALLDVATGCAQALIEGFSETETFYVPFSYARVLVRRALPARLFSHITLREQSAKDLALFDVTLCDERGDEVAVIEGFAMRRIESGSQLATAANRPSNVAVIDGALPPPHARKETTLEAALREGITPAEGVDAMDRVLASNVSAQVVVSSVDLTRWLVQLDAEAAAAQAPKAEAGAGPQFERPNLSTSFVAPRTKLERALAKQWGALLGVEHVGVHDDFFELGGQSLIAARLFGQVRKQYGVELPLSTLFEAPTIEKSAAVLATHLGIVDPVLGEEAAKGEAVSLPTPSAPLPIRAPGFKSLVLIHRGAEDRTPLFFVHGAGGNVLNFRDLSRAMDAQQPFYGLQARGVDGVLLPRDSIEEMAAAYLAEIRGVQPKGPYLLGGYSGGGVVAFEMAQLLAKEHETVELLAFVDTFHPQMPLRKTSVNARLKRLRNEGLGYVRRLAEVQLITRRLAAEQRRIEEIVKAGEPMPTELREAHLTRSFERAAAKYVPKPWQGRATLFRAEQLADIYQDGGPTYGWDAIVKGGIEVARVPGDHSNLLLEPNATILVRSLSEALNAAHQRVSAARTSEPLQSPMGR